ncbi:hypothetical protein D1970_06320 [Mesobacillus zeae]|uniref:Uncharacterized protein n=1 Tax=Mesobacillus zeae TaxID=1917180 RepID=A0A398BHC8_9BACI|nr:hypothetical protein D1970_06320 [Mesobacillus zeae]
MKGQPSFLCLIIYGFFCAPGEKEKIPLAFLQDSTILFLMFVFMNVGKYNEKRKRPLSGVWTGAHRHEIKETRRA